MIKSTFQKRGNGSKEIEIAVRLGCIHYMLSQIVQSRLLIWFGLRRETLRPGCNFRTTSIAGRSLRCLAQCRRTHTCKFGDLSVPSSPFWVSPSLSVSRSTPSSVTSVHSHRERVQRKSIPHIRAGERQQTLRLTPRSRRPALPRIRLVLDRRAEANNLDRQRCASRRRADNTGCAYAGIGLGSIHAPSLVRRANECVCSSIVTMNVSTRHSVQTI
jgi:hypothetical protein